MWTQRLQEGLEIVKVRGARELLIQLPWDTREVVPL